MTTSSVDFRSLLPADLPSGVDLAREGRELGGKVERGRSMFLEAKGMRSEREWREHGDLAAGAEEELKEYQPPGVRVEIRDQPALRAALQIVPAVEEEAEAKADPHAPQLDPTPG